MPNWKLKTVIPGLFGEEVEISTVDLTWIFTFKDDMGSLLDLLGYTHETMVFGGQRHGDTFRYNNEWAAKNGHGVMTSLVKQAEGDPSKLILRLR